jgi:hypothetical protein
MYQFSIKNIDHPADGINKNALKAFLHINTNDKVTYYEETEDLKLTTYNIRFLNFDIIRQSLQYQPKERFLIEYLGTLRHTKMMYKDDQVLAWASYDRADAPQDLSELNLPLQDDLSGPENSGLHSPTAFVQGKQSGRNISMKYPNREELVKLAKYGSWFNEEEVTLELVRKDRFDAMRFVKGQIREKRGFNYHDEYKDTMEWLRFDHNVVFSN